MYIYVCLDICNTINLESVDADSSFSICGYITGKFVCQGHRVKVKVTGKKCENPYSRNVKLPSAIIPVL